MHNHITCLCFTFSSYVFNLGNVYIIQYIKYNYIFCLDKFIVVSYWIRGMTVIISWLPGTLLPKVQTTNIIQFPCLLIYLSISIYLSIYLSIIYPYFYLSISSTCISLWGLVLNNIFFVLSKTHSLIYFSPSITDLFYILVGKFSRWKTTLFYFLHGIEVLK